MREVRKKSPIPIYGIAAVCLIYCLFFPLYRLFHFIILAVLCVAAYFILSKVFPGTVEYIEEPVSTGIPDHDALLEEGKTAVSEMKRIKDSIADTSVKAKVDRLIELTDKIFADLKDDPNDYKMIKRFSNYFLPTTIKLLNAYDRMGEINVNGENINATKQRINEILDTTITAYEKQYDALFANQALDIETDIIVLENMLKKEGLSSSDF
ncbi:MAG: 5-bromo-4-chloroindolyl phosphate hydrolysis family protein [Oscillospiraceae bacterium]|nr:5-bromo-4-chloroindolyl phosphate hydrolysis family protein [Oscillospiraceae bacterium]